MKLHYGWIVLFATFFALFAVQGVRLAFGAFIIPWENEFSLDRSMTSLISTVSFIVYGLSQPVVGRLIDRYGARMIVIGSTALVGVSVILTAMTQQSWQLFLLYGFFVSLGVGGSFQCSSCSNRDEMVYS
jgi:MFS family permease